MKRNAYEYKKTWISHNGKIPKDENGISYEIHHINNDKNDNRIENLTCVSIKEHFEIHYKQKNYKACQLIASRMNNPLLGKKMSDEFKKMQSEIQKEKVRNGTHHLLSGEIQRISNLDRSVKGIHNFQSKESIESVKKRNFENINNGTHSLLMRSDGSSVGGDTTNKRITDGTHHFQDSNLQSKLSMKAKLVNQKPVLKLSLDGEIIKEYESTQQILIENPDYKSTIYRKIANQMKYKGYLWKYK